jgi:23S rRNA (guanosine2251-2'-O)-methyltransferase
MPPQTSEVLFGRHPVLEALEAGRPCQRLLFARGSGGPVINAIYAKVRELKLPYDVQERQALDRIADGNHQGVIAYVAERAYADYEDMLKGLKAQQGFVVFLDGIQDPHNLGAIVRSAHAAGADAVVVPERGAAGLNATVAKAAAGALEHMPVCRVKNLPRALLAARDAGLWLTGLASDGERRFFELDFSGSVGLVVGSEGAGLRRLVREHCDFVAHIPMARPEVGSFNASVAAGLGLYEIFRQRSTPGGERPVPSAD